MEGKTTRGRLHKEWLDDVRAWCNEEIHELKRKTHDRDAWKQIVKRALDTDGWWTYGTLDGWIPLAELNAWEESTEIPCQQDLSLKSQLSPAALLCLHICSAGTSAGPVPAASTWIGSVRCCHGGKRDNVRTSIHQKQIIIIRTARIFLTYSISIFQYLSFMS